jgi:predicted ribosomally synthesized peptide with nif11-like leader
MATTIQATTALDQFYHAVLQDPMLQERLKAATDPENLCELAAELGQQKGYSFTKEDVLSAITIDAAIGEEYVVRLDGDDDCQILYTATMCC